ncbi:hypothetical protein NW756_006826 [Fusarium oxysporum]|nr:hypothetical protein NW756_006826 [Fusarium oxysporum]
MHFIKAVVWGISLAAVNAAAVPADGSGVTTCEYSGGDRACEAHCIEKVHVFRSLGQSSETPSQEEDYIVCQAYHVEARYYLQEAHHHFQACYYI